MNKREQLEEMLWEHLRAEVAPEVATYQVQLQKRPPKCMPIGIEQLSSLISSAVKDKPVSQVCEYSSCVIVNFILYMQVLTFLRDDINCTFQEGSTPKPAFAVFLKRLEVIITKLPNNFHARIAQGKNVLIAGPPRTFLKPGMDLSYIPSTKADRFKNAPNTVFSRCLYISKEALDPTTRTFLEVACKQSGMLA